MAVRGYLTVTVTQASSRTKANEVVWEDAFNEGFVKVEVRGGPRNIKVQSTLKPVIEGMLEWNETLELEVLEESRELRIVLCREKRSGTRVGSAVVAACGIFVEDILDAVPIDKWFEMFKPGAAGEGGFIRVYMSFSEDMPSEPRQSSPTKPMEPAENGAAAETRPGIAESFKPQLSGFNSEMQSELQVAQKENQPPLSQGSQTMPSPSTLHSKTDEAESRESTPDLPDYPVPVEETETAPQPDPATEVVTALRIPEIHYERQPVLPKKQSNKEQNSGGKKVVKFLGGLLFVAAAGAAAVYFKQEMEKRPHAQHEILVIDDDISETIRNSDEQAMHRN